MAQFDTQQQRSSQGLNHSFNMAEIALRGASTLIDIQLSALRNVAQIQARSAALFGLPDCGELFNAADKLIQCQLSTVTDQLLSSTRQFSQTCAETQRQFGRAIQQDTSQLTEQIRQSTEEVGQRARQSMEEFGDVAERQASEIQRATEGENRAASAEMQNRSGNGRSEGEGGDMNLQQREESGRKSTQARKTQ